MRLPPMQRLTTAGSRLGRCVQVFDATGEESLAEIALKEIVGDDVEGSCNSSLCCLAYDVSLTSRPQVIPSTARAFAQST